MQGEETIATLIRTEMWNRVYLSIILVANIKEVSLLDALRQPLFMAYRDHQPFNCNHLKPCPMLENPKLLQQMVT